MQSIQQHTVTTAPYTFTPNVVQQGHIEIVDATEIPVTSESFIDSVSESVDSRNQMVYPVSVVSDATASQHQEYIDESTGILYNRTQPGMLPEDDAQNELSMDPIDLEEVQKIQARMPAADPNAPVGSNKNPIRIIQQGNQYITTQDVSDEHLQQIIQVLTNQALISSSGSRPNAIYNRLTNRRIIFRVTRAKRRHDVPGRRVSSGPYRAKSTPMRGRGRGRGRGTPGRKRRKRDSDEDDPDFEPEVPEEEILPFPLARRTSTSGRISKPPRHLVKDYKHLRLEDLTTKPESSDGDEHSDGGYSDYINDGLSEDAWSEEGGTKAPLYPCPMCDRVFNSRAGVARHRSARHGPNDGRPRFRQVNPYVASMKRRAKLKEAVAAATDEELIEFAAPRLSKLLNPWDHLLLRSEDGDPPLPQVPRIILDYLSLVERTRSFLNDHLQLRCPARPKDDDSWIQKDSADESNTEKDDATADLPQEIDLTPTVDAPPEATDQRSEAAVEHNTSDITDEHFEEYSRNGTTVEKFAPSEVLQEVEDDADDGNIIIKIETPDQSAALGLPCGKYTVTNELREEYLPRRFRSILAAQQAAASVPIDDDYLVSQKRAVVAVDTADDDAVDATLRTDSEPLDNEALNTTADLQSQQLVTLGGELLLVPEGGLGGPVPEEWLASGAFLSVLTETGETSDLVMEAATGRLFHRPTGHLVSLADSSNVPTSQPDTVYEEPGAVPDFVAYEDEETTIQQSEDQSETAREKSPTTNGSSSPSKPRSRAKQQHPPPSPPEQLDEADAQREELLQRIAQSGEVIDLNTLFPGVSVTEVSPGVCLVTKPNGDRFNVEHGGDGITLETLQTILQMDSESLNA
ncbi:unnamed protein product [Dicrocoelium dendriticum]|nr:unnamed protein product [Dicrocoelium dendriticum]